MIAIPTSALSIGGATTSPSNTLSMNRPSEGRHSCRPIPQLAATRMSPLRRPVSCLAILAALLISASLSSASSDPISTPLGLPLTPTASPAAPTNVVLDSLRDTERQLASTNLFSTAHQGGFSVLSELQRQLELARQQHRMRLTQSAVPNFIAILKSPNAVDAMKRVALLELGLIAQEDNDLPKAQQIFSQYLSRWPEDPSVPEIVLRLGLTYRQMGLNTAALTKFYAVMTSALVLKTTQFDYYQRLVLQAQTEIAETHYVMNQHQEAVEFLTRVLKSENPLLNKPQLQYKLIRSLASLARHQDVASQSLDFFSRHLEAPEQPEVRFLCASAYKQLGRNGDALQQVLLLLQEQRDRTKNNPAAWAYWQQRLGNEIANQLYRDGDYGRALDVYANLAQLDPSPAWQLPVWYQMGMSYERLDQTHKAVETYVKILGREKELGTNATPSLRAVLDMARWRRDYLNWQSKAETVTRDLRTVPPINAQTNVTAAVRPPEPAPTPVPVKEVSPVVTSSPGGPNRDVSTSHAIAVATPTNSATTSGTTNAAPSLVSSPKPAAPAGPPPAARLAQGAPPEAPARLSRFGSAYLRMPDRLEDGIAPETP